MSKLSVITRAVSVLSVVTILGVGVTYAASLTTTASLTDNELTSATASLLVDGSDTGTEATASEAGFSFANIIPGADYGTGETFKLKNAGTSDLAVTVYMTAGIADGVLNGEKVHFKFTNGADTFEYTLNQMKANFNNLPGVTGTGSLGKDDPTTPAADGEEATLTVQVKMDEDAVVGGSAELTDFDFVFTGTAVVPAPVQPE